jgi:hypothetical protein
MQVKRVGVLSLGKVFAVLYGLFGLIFGVLFSLFAIMGAALGGLAAETGEEAGAAVFGLLFGVGAVIAMPVIYAIMGFIGGILTAALYNLSARFVGGIELDLE